MPELLQQEQITLERVAEKLLTSREPVAQLVGFFLTENPQIRGREIDIMSIINAVHAKNQSTLEFIFQTCFSHPVELLKSTSRHMFDVLLFPDDILSAEEARYLWTAINEMKCNREERVRQLMEQDKGIRLLQRVFLEVYKYVEDGSQSTTQAQGEPRNLMRNLLRRFEAQMGTGDLSKARTEGGAYFVAYKDAAKKAQFDQDLVTKKKEVTTNTESESYIQLMATAETQVLQDSIVLALKSGAVIPYFFSTQRTTQTRHYSSSYLTAQDVPKLQFLPRVRHSQYYSGIYLEGNEVFLAEKSDDTTYNWTVKGVLERAIESHSSQAKMMDSPEGAKAFLTIKCRLELIDSMSHLFAELGQQGIFKKNTQIPHTPHSFSQNSRESIEKLEAVLERAIIPSGSRVAPDKQGLSIVYLMEMIGWKVLLDESGDHLMAYAEIMSEPAMEFMEPISVGKKKASFLRSLGSLRSRILSDIEIARSLRESIVNGDITPLKDFINDFFQPAYLLSGSPLRVAQYRDPRCAPPHLNFDFQNYRHFLKGREIGEAKARFQSLKPLPIIENSQTGERYLNLYVPEYAPIVEIRVIGDGFTSLEEGPDFHLLYAPLNGYYQVVFTAQGSEKINGKKQLSYELSLGQVKRQPELPKKVGSVAVNQERLLHLTKLLREAGLDLLGTKLEKVVEKKTLRQRLRRVFTGKNEINSKDVLAALGSALTYTIAQPGNEQRLIYQQPDEGLEIFEQMSEEDENLKREIIEAIPAVDERSGKIRLQCRHAARLAELIVTACLEDSSAPLYFSQLYAQSVPFTSFLGFRLFGLPHADNHLEKQTDAGPIKMAADITPGANRMMARDALEQFWQKPQTFIKSIRDSWQLLRDNFEEQQKIKEMEVKVYRAVQEEEEKKSEREELLIVRQDIWKKLNHSFRSEEEKYQILNREEYSEDYERPLVQELLDSPQRRNNMPIHSRLLRVTDYLLAVGEKIHTPQYKEAKQSILKILNEMIQQDYQENYTTFVAHSRRQQLDQEMSNEWPQYMTSFNQMPAMIEAVTKLRAILVKQ